MRRKPELLEAFSPIFREIRKQTQRGKKVLRDENGRIGIGPQYKFPLY